MIRSLIKLAVLLVICILVYNYFFGTNSEQEQSREFFGKLKDVVVAGAGVLKSEKQKFDAGKYDKLMDQLGSAYKAVRSQAQFVDKKVLTRLDELEQRKAGLQRQLDTIQQNEQSMPELPQKGIKQDPKTAGQQAAKAADQQRRKEELQRQLEQLYKDSEDLMKDAQQK